MSLKHLMIVDADEYFDPGPEVELPQDMNEIPGKSGLLFCEHDIAGSVY